MRPRAFTGFSATLATFASALRSLFRLRQRRHRRASRFCWVLLNRRVLASVRLHAFEHGSPFGSDPLRAILTLNEAVRKDVQSGHARGQSLGALGPLRPLVARIATCG
jgi:hypothetical protein